MWVEVCYLQPRILSDAHILIQNWCKISTWGIKALRKQRFYKSVQFITGFSPNIKRNFILLKKTSSNLLSPSLFPFLSFFLFLLGWRACCTACGILVPRPGIEIVPSAMKAWSFNQLLDCLFISHTDSNANQNLPSLLGFPKFAVHPTQFAPPFFLLPSSSNQLYSTLFHRKPFDVFNVHQIKSIWTLFILLSLISPVPLGKSCRKTSCMIPEKPWIQVKNSNLI